MKQYDNSTVRRQDRVLECNLAKALMIGGEYGFLSLVEQREGALAGYGIPLNFVWDGADYLYLHCSPQGHKLESLDRCARVSFCVVGATHVISDQFTTAYQSIVVRGEIERKLSTETKMEALLLLLDKYSPNHKDVGAKSAEKSLHRTEILRLKILSISGKCKSV